MYIGHGPAFLAVDCQLVSDEGHRQLRSANWRTYVVRRTYTAAMETCFAELQVLSCGTSFLLIWDQLALTLTLQNGCKNILFGCQDHEA